MNNKHIICKDCSRTFMLPVWEQNVYKANGKPFPTSCSTCREIRRKHNSRFTEADYRLWVSVMTNRIPVRRDTKHPTDDFRGFMKRKAS